MNELVFEVLQESDGGYVAECLGESIVTEYSYKYDVDELATLAASAGFAREQVWVDAGRRFSVHFFRVPTANAARVPIDAE